MWLFIFIAADVNSLSFPQMDVDNACYGLEKNPGEICTIR